MSTQQASRAAEPSTSAQQQQQQRQQQQRQQQQQQQLVDDATRQLAREMSTRDHHQQAHGGGGGEDGGHGEAGLMSTLVGGRVAEQRPWSRREDEAITRMVAQLGTDQWTLLCGNLCAEIPGALRTAKDCGIRWFHHLDPSLKEARWTEREDQILRDAQLRMGDRWAEIAKLLTGRTENCVKSRWYATLQKKSVSQGNTGAGMDDDGDDGESGGGSATPRPGGGGDDGEGVYGSFALDVVPGGGGGGEVCSPVGRAGGPESPRPFMAPKTRPIGSTAAHVAPCAPAAPAVEAGVSPALVPLASFPLGMSSASASSVEGLDRWQLSDEQPLVGQSVIGSLTKKETATLQTAYEELNKKIEGNSRGGGSARNTGAIGGAETVGASVGVGATLPPTGGTETPIPLEGKGQVPFERAASAQATSESPPQLPAPASSVGVQDGCDSVTGKRPRPRLFVNTNVDPGMYIGHDPHGSEGASAAIAAARSAARATSRLSHPSSVPYGCPPGMGSSAAAAASAAAEAAARYASGMGNVANQPMAPMHHHRPHPPHHPHHPHHHQQQQMQQQMQHPYMGGVGRRAGGGRVGVGSDYPIAIPGTSVRRYMHVQLLLALMSAPGLKVVAPAKTSWDRLGYYPVDEVFGPPGPDPLPTSPPRLTPTVLPPVAVTSPILLAEIDSPPAPKRARSVRGPDGSSSSSSVHDAMGIGGSTNTGAMAMPPPQHSPRTWAMLSGLPVGSENAMMMGEPGDFQASPTSLLGMGGIGPMSPYQFPLSSGVGGILSGGRGSDGSSDGSASGGDPSQHFDFAAAVGGMVPNYTFADFASIYSPNPVSPTFGASRLSPLAGPLSPQSLSPQASWVTGFQDFSS